MSFSSDHIYVVERESHRGLSSFAGLKPRVFQNLLVVVVLVSTLLPFPIAGIASASHGDSGNPLHLNGDPESDTNPVNTSHTFTVTVTNPGGAAPVASSKVDFEFEGANDPDSGFTPTGSVDDTCTTSGGGTCTVTVFGSSPGTLTATAWVDDDNDDGTADLDFTETATTTPENGNDTDLMVKRWTAATTTSYVINVNPEFETNAEGTNHTWFATVTAAADGSPVSGVAVDVEYVDLFLIGPNDPDTSNSPGTPDDGCTTDSTGRCSFDLFGRNEGYVSSTAWVDIGPGNELDTSEGFADDADNTDGTGKLWQTSDNQVVLDVEPDSDWNFTGTTHRLTATASFEGGPVSGTAIDFELTGANDIDGNAHQNSPDLTCTTNASGVCTVQFSGSVVGTTSVISWVDANNGNPSEANCSNNSNSTGCEALSDPPDDDTDVVEKGWRAPPTRLNVVPETDSNPVDTDHVFTATATDNAGNPISGANIDFEYTGANDPDSGDSKTSPDDTCTTGAGGTCTVTLGDTESTMVVGTTTATAWLDVDENNATSEANVEVLGDPEDDDTDVVVKQWTVGPPTVLDVAPESDANPADSLHTFTATVTDQFGNVPTSSVTVDFEYEGANDPDDNTNPTSPEDTCTAGPANGGVCSVTLGDNSDGLGSAETTNEGGTTTATAWIDSDGNNATSEANVEVLGDPEDDDTDVVIKVWTAPSVLDLESEVVTNPVNTDHETVATVTDQFGNPVAGVNVDVEYTGANDPDSGDSQTSPDDTCTTGAAGTCTVVLGDGAESTAAFGTTTVTGWIDANNNNGTSEANIEALDDPEDDDTDVTQKIWTDANKLDVEPETATNPVNTDHTVTVTVTNNVGSPVSGEEVLFEYVGANDPDDGNSPSTADDTCTPGATGTCTVILGDDETTTEAGVTTIIAYMRATPDSEEGRDEGVEPGDPEPDLTDVAEKTWTADVASMLDVEPESDSNEVGTDHVFTATVTDQFDNPISGTNVDFEYGGSNDPDDGVSTDSPDDSCTTGLAGTCTVVLGDTETTTDPGTTTVTAWIDLDGSNASSEADLEDLGDDEDDDTDVVEKGWTAGPAVKLDIAPETSTNPAGTQHTFTATVTDQFDNPLEGIHVDFEYAGANDPDNNDIQTSPGDTCATDSSGVCTVTMGDADPLGGAEVNSELGTTTATAWIDIDDEDATPEADSSEQVGDDGDNDNTDVATKFWTAGAATILDVEPETDSNQVGTDHTFTATVTDAFGNAVSDTSVDFEYTGANDLNGDSKSTPDDTCTTSSAGTCTVVLGDTELTLLAGTTTATAWIDSDGSDGTTEGDTTETATAEDSDNTDVVIKRWTVGPAAFLNIEPESDSNQVDTDHSFTATVTDLFGNLFEGATVDFEYVGANDPDAADSQDSPDETCTTNANGVCTVTLGDTETTTDVGTTTATGWIDIDNNDGTEEADSEPLGGPDNNDTDVVVKQWTPGPAARLDVGPETDSNQVGTDHTFTATVTDAFGNAVSGTNVDFEYTGANGGDSDQTTPDDTCTTNASGICTVTFEGTSATSPGTTTATAWLDPDEDADSEADPSEQLGDDGDNDNTDVVAKQWTVGPAARLDVGPETDSNQVGTLHTFTATATDAFGNAVAGANVDFEYTGANDPDGNSAQTSVEDTCTTDSNGICAVTLGDSDGLGSAETTNSPGTTTATAWIDSNNNNATSEADSGETLGQDGDNDNTDVVAKQWTVGPAARLDVGPETDSNQVGTDHTFTATVTDAFGNAVSGTNVDFEYTGANDTNGDSKNVPDDSCDTNSSGVCSVTLGDTELTTSVGTTTATAWIDPDGNGDSDDADGTEQLGDDGDNDDTDVAVKQWTVGPAAILNVEPETDSNQVDTDHTFTATVTDQFGNVISGTNVDFEYTGANDVNGDSKSTPDDTCTTNASGVCSVTLGDTELTTSVGTTTATAWIDADGSNGSAEANSEELADTEDDDTDVVIKVWTVGPAAFLNLEPETDSNQVDTDHTFTATVTDAFGNPVSGTNVDFEYTGANDTNGDTKATPDDTCNTNTSGICSVTFGDTESTTGVGTSTATAWIDPDGNGDTDEADTEALSDPENDDTDIVVKQWTVGPAATLNVEPESDSNQVDTDHTFTATVTDPFGNVISGTNVDFEYTGANDTNGDSKGTPDDSCTTNSSGVCAVTLGDTELTTSVGTTTAIAWIDPDGNGDTDDADTEALSDPENDDTDIVVKQWTVGVAAVLDIGPETDTNQVGSSHSWTATVTDLFGNPVSGAPVDFEYEGANDPDGNSTQTSVEDSCTTSSSGNCSVTLGDSDGIGSTETTNSGGTTTATAWIDSDNNNATTEANAEPANYPENDDTDVALKAWSSAPPVFEVTVPEGATHSGFTTFILIANPASVDATDVDITFLTPTGPISPAGTQNLTVPAGSRRTIDVNLALGIPADVATKVSSTGVQVTAEAAVHKAGSLAEMIMTAQAPQDTWLMAEGATHSGFTTFITIANPNTTSASTVDVTFFRPGGITQNGPQDLVVPAGSRRTVNVNTALGAADDVSTLVEVDSGPSVVAGRSLHKATGGDLGIGGSVGSLGTAPSHVVAEGATHSGFHTFVLVFSQGPSTIDINFLTSSGLVQGDQNVNINGRYTIDVNAELPSADDVATLIDVDSGAPIAVEGTVQKVDSSGFVIADSVSSSGASVGDSTGSDWLVSEGATHSGFFTFVLIANPNATAAVVDVTFLTKGSGPVPGPQSLVVPAFGRRTVSVNLFVTDDVSTLVRAESGTVVVEMAIDRATSSGFSKGRSLAFEL